MTDTLSPRERSRRMSLVRGKDTKPERAVRSIVRELGHRYSLHRESLPGCPDLVFARKRKAVFVHGCFWHRHEGCVNNRMPKSKVKFWKSKLDGNKKRDRMNQRELKALRWRFLVIWECQLRHKNRLRMRLVRFLGE